jgi:hypothetical protein
VSNEPQHDGEPDKRQEPAVLLVRYPPYLVSGSRVSSQPQEAVTGYGPATGTVGLYLSQHVRVEPGALEKGDGHLARHDADIIRVGLAKELAEDAVLLGREAELREACRGGVIVVSMPSFRPSGQ